MSRGWKLLWLAHASSSVPSTVKCSCDSNRAVSAWIRTASKNAAAMSQARSQSRFFVKVVGFTRIIDPEAHKPPEQQVVL